MIEPTQIHCCDRQHVSQSIREKNVGLAVPGGSLSPCAISLTPWQISRAEWKTAVATARALSRLFSQVAQSPGWLLQNRLPGRPHAGLLDKLFDLLENPITSGSRPEMLNLMRHDFLMDKDRNWKLVETNSIAAGMGPFGQMATSIQAELPENRDLEFVANPATERQTSELAKAARSLAATRRPVIAFIVDPHEDNVHDQNMLKSGLRDQGIEVLTLTLEDLYRRAQTDQTNRLILNGRQRVDLLYYRTGYNLSDHEVGSQSADQVLEFRAWLEQRRVVVCPSLAQQLATSKWIQMHLSRLSSSELSELFFLNPLDAELASEALATESLPCPRGAELDHRLATGGWLLKTPGEGGGNVRTAPSQGHVPPGSILMRRVTPSNRMGSCVLRDRALECESDLTAEVGVFTAGPGHEYAGYLVRSKPPTALEAGVHRGQGMLDALAYKK